MLAGLLSRCPGPAPACETMPNLVASTTSSRRPLSGPADEFLVDVRAVDLGGVDEVSLRGRARGGWSGSIRRRRFRRRCSACDMPMAPRPIRATFRSPSFAVLHDLILLVESPGYSPWWGIEFQRRRSRRRLGCGDSASVTRSPAGSRPVPAAVSRRLPHRRCVMKCACAAPCQAFTVRDVYSVDGPHRTTSPQRDWTSPCRTVRRSGRRRE